MLRVLVLVICLYLTESRTDIRQDVRLLERVKRWRDFDCPPPYYHPHRYYHEPPYWHHRPPGENFYHPYPQPEPEPEPEPQRTFQQQLPTPGKAADGNKPEKEVTTEAVKSEKQSENLTADKNESKSQFEIPECDDCQSSGIKKAISNAESETGDAIAISISRNNH